MRQEGLKELVGSGLIGLSVQFSEVFSFQKDYHDTGTRLGHGKRFATDNICQCDNDITS